MMSVDSGNRRNRRAHPFDQLQVLTDRVPAFHRGEYPVRPRLHRQMQRWLHLGLGRHRLDDRVAHVRGMRRGEANSLHAVERRDQAQQAAEIDVAGAIGVDRLPEQHDFPYPALGKSADVGHNRLGRHAALASAHIRHHAKRAKAVASTHRGNVGAHAALVRGRDIGIGFVAVQAHVDFDRLPRRIEAGAAEQFGQPAVAVGPGDEVEPRRLLDQRGAVVLRHASEQPQAQFGTGVLEARKLAQAPQHPFLGMLANRAGVEQDDVGVFGTAGGGISGAAQYPAHQLGVGDIHLAAVRLDKDPRRPGLVLCGLAHRSHAVYQGRRISGPRQSCQPSGTSNSQRRGRGVEAVLWSSNQR